MSQGDSLVIFLTGSHSRSSHEEHVPQRSHDDDSPANDPVRFSPQDSETPDEDMSQDQPSVALRTRAFPERLQTVKLYRLHGPTIQARVRWGQFDNLILDVARVLHVPVAQITALHHILSGPVDETDNDVSLIVHMLHDIPDGSSDQLILMDIELHQQAVPTDPPRTPVVTRHVHRVVSRMARVHVLMLGGVQEFCRLYDDRCLVHVDHNLWALHDVGVRRFSHGQYVRVAVPPTEDQDLDRVDLLMQEEETGLLQTSWNTQSGHERQAKPSADTTSIDVPLMLPPHVPMQRTCPAPDGDFHWMQDIGDLFVRYGHFEPRSGITFIHIMTWFVHHETHQVCFDPRPVRLEEQAILWLEDLRFAWRDRLDQTQTLSVHFLQPCPPQRRASGIAGHILLEQARRHPAAAGILTGLRCGFPCNVMKQGAFSIANPFSLDQAIQLLNFASGCSPSRCKLWHDQREYDDAARIHLASGFAVQLRAHGPDAANHEQFVDQFADLSLLQTSAQGPQQRGVELPVDNQERSAFVFNPHAPAFQPANNAIQSQSAFIQDLSAQWTITAMSWQEEVASTLIMTWFVDHRNAFPTCISPREVRLYDDFMQWETPIKRTWYEFLDPNIEAQLYLVRPTPTEIEPGMLGHVILVQAPRVDWASSLVTVNDPIMNALNDGRPMRLVVTTTVHIWPAHIAQVCGYDPSCLLRQRSVYCYVIVEARILAFDQYWPGRTGLSLELHVNRFQTEITHSAQVHSPGIQALHRNMRTGVIPGLMPTEYAEVPHDLGSEITTCHDRSVWRIVSPESIPTPTFIDIECNASDQQVQAALRTECGNHCFWCQADLHIAVLMEEWQSRLPFHYLYLDTGEPPFHFTYHEVHDQIRTDIDHMRSLHCRGYHRAVVLRIQWYDEVQVGIIHFRNQRPGLPTPPARIATPWPDRHTDSSIPHQIFPLEKSDKPSPTCAWSTGVTHQQLHALFDSELDILSTSVEGLTLPLHVQQALSQCAPLDRLDRLVIYTDGSSQPEHRRKPPIQADLEGHGDTWSFVVLGEQYIDEHHSRIAFLGWTAQPVLYASDAAHYIGSQVIGSETAEREALFWSGLWRLALNSTLPTVFCSDSKTAGRQAAGLDGSRLHDESYSNLRAVFQCLEGSMGESLHIQHVRGHSSDPWNDLADLIAKHERNKSCYLPRQEVDMRSWSTAFKHLWLHVTPNVGMPAFSGTAFDVGPPQMPQDVQPQVSTRLCTAKVLYNPSFATANVNSLHLGPDGYSGKLQYLRDQMKSLGLLFLGIQESRSGAACSTTDGVLRLGSGSDRGHHGVELWVNLLQPFAQIGSKRICFQKQHFVVVHSDPRLLLVRAIHELWQAWIVVAHAPQSGQRESDRQNWWDHLHTVLLQHVHSSSLFVLIDANAAPGPTDLTHVGPADTASSKSTPMLRSLLELWSLALPATFPCHIGPRNTWTSPDGDGEHCIDHICVPTSDLKDCQLSRVVEEFDLGNLSHDHNVTAIQLQWEQVSQYARTSQGLASNRSRRFDPVRLRSALSAFHVPAWQQDIHTHVQDHTQHLLQCLRQASPVSVITAKKSFITDDIWQLRTMKLASRKLCKEIDRRERMELIRATWLEWKAIAQTRPMQPDHGAVYHCYTNALQCWKLFQRVHLHVIASRLKRQLKVARREALRRDLETMHDRTAAADILRTVKQHVGSTNLKRVQKPTLPMLNKVDGQPCSSPEEIRDEWINFFGQMEGGQRMEWQDYIQHWQRSLASFCQKQVCLGPTDIPSLTDLESAFRRVRPGKAIGLDGVPPEICHAFPTILARQYFSSLLKLMIHGQESILHKGGVLVPAYKGKGSQTEPSSYRSLLISSHMGKVLHRTIRQHQSHLYETYLCTQQLGGRKKVPVNLGLHEARSFLRGGQQRGQSVGLLMVDLTEAFYRVLRPLAVGGSYTDEQLAAIVHKLGMPKDVLHELQQHLNDPSAIEQARLPHHLCRVLHAIHTDTFFQIHGQEDCCRTSVGSRPGDCFADVVFSYLFARVLKGFQQKIEHLGLQEFVADVDQFDPFSPAMPASSRKPYLGPVWMDDLCIGLRDETPELLIHKIGVVTSLLLETLEGYGMTPNLKKGKTEVVLSLRGTGVRKWKKALFGPVAPGTLPVLCETGLRHISVVGQYQHLGGILHHAGDHRVEMRRRVAIAHSAFNEHRKHIFQNQSILLRKRVQLFGTLILSKLVYGSESWVLHDLRSKAFLHASVMRLYRRLLGGTHPTHETDDQVLAALQLPSPTELFRQTRLRYIATLHACSEVVTWDLLNRDRDWCALIRDDLNWLWTQLANSSSLQDPAHHLASWRYLWVYHPTYWKGIIKRAIKHAIFQRHNSVVVSDGHQAILELLQQGGHVRLVETDETRPEPAGHAQCGQYACLHCDRAFKTRGGEGAHMFKCHGKVATLRMLFDQTRCEVCMREYFTFSKLHNHLRHSHRCRNMLIQRGMHCQPVGGHGSREDGELKRHHDGLLPPLQSQGPALPPPREREIEHFDVELYAALTEALMSDASLSNMRAVTQEFAREHPISWTHFHGTICSLRANVTQQDLAMFDLTPRAWHSLFDDLCKPEYWKCFQSTKPAVRPECSVEDLEWQCDNMQVDPPSDLPPRSFGQHRFILHAFSGRRRQGDFQFYLDALANAHPGFVIHTLSVDIVLDTTWGDVSDARVQKFWISAAMQGWIIGFLGGPPCETWSRAREHTLAGSQRSGPRVIRTLAQMWGLSSLALKEIRQILVGNQLMFFALHMMTALYVQGGIGALEHPAEPPQSSSASIWRTPVLSLLRELPGMHIWELAQGLLGAPSAKPTMVLTLNLPTFGREVCRWRTVDELPKQVNIGQGK